MGLTVAFLAVSGERGRGTVAAVSVATQNHKRQSGSEDPGRGTVEKGHARTPRAVDCERRAHPRQRVLAGGSGILAPRINPARQRHSEEHNGDPGSRVRRAGRGRDGTQSWSQRRGDQGTAALEAGGGRTGVVSFRRGGWPVGPGAGWGASKGG